MRQWATEHGKAMQYTTKDSAGRLPLNVDTKGLPVEERVELEYKDTNGTQKKAEELLLILTAMPLIFCLRSIRSRSGRVISLSHRAVASYQ